MVRVQGHWRSTGWVQGHLRHPHRPGADQFGLVLPARTPISLDPARYAPDGVVRCCLLADRPAADVPRPRAPDEAAEEAARRR